MLNLTDTISLAVVLLKANSIIMRTPQYSLARLRHYLERHFIGTFKQIGRALGDPARITVFRLLHKAGGLSSYSHRGKYCTLGSVPRFDARGLWKHREIGFSRFGNLLETLKALVNRSPRGYTAQELQEQVGVKTKHALLQLVARKDLQRIRQEGVYVYLAGPVARARDQQTTRRQQQVPLPGALLGPKARLAIEEAKAALLLFWATLDERQRRLYAALESARIGHGGDQLVADLFGIDRHTVARGREELLEGQPPPQPVRGRGAGRTSVEKKRPQS